jgi:hypothetical protein
MDYYRKIVLNYFSKQLIDLSNWVLRFQSLAELSLDRSICGLDIASLMVMLHKLITVKLEVVKHLLPDCRAARPSRFFVVRTEMAVNLSA